ncbi:NmrA family transcriptional regulator [Paenibacillus sp.]|uniref:NmrA family NAD(P)-binding protein n=1 Tax=Paenibacillus sp. TaxID=58172 RepID=UPI00282D628E|nr:NmrA family transcriptional regulator [Paenibacillus sp.]MDR0267800.1 NmrA family transcriptional regulator [Paenibacillus sp.]
MNKQAAKVVQDSRSEQPILVLGGTGKTGRRVAERLTKLGFPVRIGSRSGELPFDWEDSNTWLSSLANVRAAYISFYPDLAVPGAADAIERFARMAVDHGVKRLVLLSGRGEEEAQLSEKALQNSDADWTIVRASWFCQNFSESFLLDMVLGGEVALPVSDVKEPFIDADDIADVAVVALTGDDHIGQIYELTGPRSITFAEATEAIAKASGREVKYTYLTHEQFLSMLEQQEVPEEYVALLSYLFTQVLDGRNSHLADGVQCALGREPRDFADYAKIAAATGVWEV